MLFIDRLNSRNNLRYCERISTTNPCGEVPLPPYGVCNLGSVNLTRFVEQPFTRWAQLNLPAISGMVPDAVRFLDNVIEVANFPLPAQAEQARATRRIGLGFTGLGDTLAMLGLRYDQIRGRNTAAVIMRTIRDTAYQASVNLAREKGAFPKFDAHSYLKSPGIAALPSSITRW